MEYSKNKALAKTASAALQNGTKAGTFAGMPQPAVQSVLEQYAGAIANALPGGLKTNRVIQAAVFKIVSTPALQACTQKSVIGSVLNAALLGLSPALGECHFVPYKNRDSGMSECQFQPDYKGLIALARRSAQIKNIYADVVRRGDEFQVKSGLHRDLIHNPDLEGGSERPIDYAYAVVWYENGAFDFEVMDAREIAKARAKNLMQRNGPAGAWLEFEGEMAKKSAIRRLSKRLPKSDELAVALATDGAVIRPENIEAGAVKVEEVSRIDTDEAEPITQHEEVDPARAAELAKIKAGADDCNDEAALEKFWRQNAKEWINDHDVVNIFTVRKSELTNGN